MEEKYKEYNKSAEVLIIACGKLEISEYREWGCAIKKKNEIIVRNTWTKLYYYFLLRRS